MAHSPSEARLDEARALMDAFAERSGFGAGSRRYLWTDAFAVCNDLALWRHTGSRRYAELATRLIDDVHHVLGHHRNDDERAGWLSGLGELEGARHPTRGGLRIGKPLPERKEGEPPDEELEWDRDGQYYHYLTRWMHALDQAARVLHRPEYNRWARELAQTAYQAFALPSLAGLGPRLAWKMSVDLSRPLVPSMGQHDPLDGFLTCAELRATARDLGDNGLKAGPDLVAEQRSLRAMSDPTDWATTDPLGLGGLLIDASRAAQLVARGALDEQVLVPRLLGLARSGTFRYVELGDLRRPASQRLAFRELGLAIGLSAVEVVRRALERSGLLDMASRTVLQQLEASVAIGDAITSFWREPVHRRNRSWAEHQDINDVMLASALVPDGVLGE